MLLIFISRVARQGFDCQRNVVGIVVNNTFLVFTPFTPLRNCC